MYKNYKDMNLDFIEKILRELPQNIFFKDDKCRYIFATHYWNHIEHDDPEKWSIAGKTDLEIRKNKKNAMLAYEQDKKIIETGKECSYVIQECIDGQLEYLEIVKKPVRNEKNEIIGIVGIISNITENVMLKQNLDVYANIDMMTSLLNRKGFIEKIPETVNSCKNNNRTCIMLLVSYISEIRTSIPFYDSLLIMANALRMPQIPDKICARIDDNIFAVIYPCENTESIYKAIEEFIVQTNEKIKALVGSASDFAFPELILKWHELKFNELFDAENILENMFKEIMSTISSKDNNCADYRKQLYRLRNDILANPQADWNISEITKEISISKSHFHRMYKSLFSVSCVNDIINARLDKARHLLIDTDMRVQEISEKCGYKNEAHFMRQFRDKMGVTALQFRKQYKNKK